MMSNAPKSPREVLRTAWLIWGAMLFGEVSFAAIAVFLALGIEPADETVTPFFLIAIAMSLVAIPIAYFVRNQVYKQGWEGDTVRPGAYLSGNIIFWACCEGPAMFGLVTFIVDGSISPQFVVPLVCLWLHLVNRPTGRPLEPAGPRI